MLSNILLAAGAFAGGYITHNLIQAWANRASATVKALETALKTEIATMKTDMELLKKKLP